MCMCGYTYGYVYVYNLLLIMLLWKALTDIIISVFCSSAFPLSSPLLPSLSFCALTLVIVTRSWPFSLYRREFLQRWRVMRQVKYLLGGKMTSLMIQMVKHLPAMMEDPGSIPGSGRSPGEGNDNPLQYSFLENPMNARVW